MNGKQAKRLRKELNYKPSDKCEYLKNAQGAPTRLVEDSNRAKYQAAKKVLK